MIFRIIKISIKFFIFFVAISLFIDTCFGYDNIITHPKITEAAIKIYKRQIGKTLTDDQINWIVKGSIDEDADPRYLNHYYDPVTGYGLNDFDEYFQKQYEGIPAKEWARDQSGIIGHTGDYSESAILKNYRDGNLERAYQGMGHILHLVQDMSVPAHTRNDSHAEGDLYENWAKQNGKIDLSNVDFIAINNLDQAFDELALFSHNNFFSKSSIKIDENNNYRKIRKFENSVEIEYLINKINGVDYYIAFSDNPNSINVKYQVDNYQIHYDYWQILHPKAVGYSAGVIDYFIKQFEQIDAEKKAQQDSGLLVWNKTKITFSNLDDNAKYVWGDFFMPARAALADTWDFAGESYRDIKNELFIKIVDPQVPMANISQQLEDLNSDQVSIEQDNITLAEDQKNNEIAQNSQQNSLIISESQNNNTQQSQLLPTPSESEIIHAPYYRAPEVIHAPYQANTELAQIPINTGQALSGSITNQFQGQFNGSMQTMESTTEELDNPLFAGQNDSMETAQNDETQNQITEDTDQPQQQENAEQLSSKQDSQQDQDNAQNQNAEQNNQEQDQQTQDSESQQEALPEPILPDINFYVSDYEVRKLNFILNWEDRNDAAQGWELQYKLAPNFDWQNINITSSASSHSFIAEYDDLTYYFRLRAQYDGGNFSDWIELPIDISSKPVVINEVAWMGTSARDQDNKDIGQYDEWIEFANKTNQEIDLMGWTLYIGNQPINLTGKISPNGFYLLERTNDDPISNIQADQFYTGALTNPNGNYGQQLILQDELGNVADTTMSAYAGDNNTKKTSERVSVWGSGGAGATGNNWKTYTGQGGEAQDAAGNAIMGTPRAKNSVADEFVIFNSQPSKSLIFLKNRGTVLVENDIWIPQGIKLFIEPGGVWKLSNRGSLTFSGELIARGTPEEKIVFTSTSDDEYGADINGNDSNVINWLGMNFLELSKGDLNNVIVRNVGSVWISSAISINKADVKISDSVFENNSENVLVFDYVDADISNSEFKNNTGHAITVAHSGANISNSVFENNTGAGLWLGGASGDVRVSNSSFTGNKAPIETNRLTNFNISDSTVLNNTTNGIWASGGIEESQNSITISSDMPFVFSDNGTSVDSGKTLTLAPGTVFKFAQRAMGIYGTLNAVGTPDQPIVFTSLEDDVYGGDTNNDGNATMPGEGSWYWMQFVSGENSILGNVIVRYAGKLGYSMGGPPSGGSGISVEPGVVNFVMRDSIVSSSVVGATISSDGTIIEDTKFVNNSQTGLNIAANNATVSNITFENNQKAFQSTSAYMATILLSDFIFNGNTYNYWPEDLINYLTQ